MIKCLRFRLRRKAQRKNKKLNVFASSEIGPCANVVQGKKYKPYLKIKNFRKGETSNTKRKTL